MKYCYPDTALLVFAKAPEPGKVKTRLIPALGKEGACNLYSKMASDIIARLAESLLCPVVLFCHPNTHHVFFTQHASKLNLETVLQNGNNLGERMHNATELMLNNYNKVIVIGTDCPEYSKEYIETAINRLDHNDIVLGPAIDGGYVLIGMKKACKFIFSDIEWSTNNVLQATLARVRQKNFSYQLLSPLNDIDEPDDLHFL